MTPTFTIDRANERVAGHRTMAAAREAVAFGRAASWAATVRPGVVAVDIDVDDDETAAAVLEPLVAWCDEHSVWVYVRRSGGGPGRWHLFAVASELTERFRAVVSDARERHGLTSRQVDLRRTIRPLSAPHRRTGKLDIPEDVEVAASELVAASRQPGGGRGEPEDKVAATVARVALAEPVSPLPGSFWQDVARKHPRGVDRSAVEFAHTAAMVRAGMSEAEAWSVVDDPAHHGLARARRRGREWWRRYQWNAVEPVERTPLAPRTGVQRTLWEGPYDWGRLVIPAARGLRRVWDRWGTRQRHTIDHVLAVVADRFTRRGLGPLPMSVRSLREDTGFSVNTVRAALAELCAAGFLTREEPEASAGPLAVHIYALNLDALIFAEVTDTTRGYAPPPPADPLWLAPPAATLSTWLSLHLGGALTKHQRTTCVSWLHGRKLTTSDGTPRTLASSRVARPREGLQAWKASREAHRVERQKFRAALTSIRERARALWEEGRQRALERQAARDARRCARWWSSLPDSERAHRRERWRAWFAGLTYADQQARREMLAERRHLAQLGGPVMLV